MRVALTGGIACGKSLFAKFLSELGIQLIDADDVVHELEASGGVAAPLILSRFGTIDRSELAKIVFASPSARADLEDILFPLVRRRISDYLASPKHRTSSTRQQASLPPIAVIPLLFESQWDNDFDIIVCIASSVEKQIERMMLTRGYSREHAEARLAAQMPVAEKIVRAHYTVMNDSTPEHLKEEAKRLVEWLKERLENECRRYE